MGAGGGRQRPASGRETRRRRSESDQIQGSDTRHEPVVRTHSHVREKILRRNEHEHEPERETAGLHRVEDRSADRTSARAATGAAYRITGTRQSAAQSRSDSEAAANDGRRDVGRKHRHAATIGAAGQGHRDGYYRSEDDAPAREQFGFWTGGSVTVSRTRGLAAERD